MILGSLDTARSLLLKATLKVSLFRQIYLTRAYRLLAFFLFSLVFNFTLAIKFPLWALLLGPIILGTPHLVASVRYLPKLTTLDRSFSTKKLYFIIGAVYVSVATARLFGGSFASTFIENGPNLLELIGCALALVAIGVFSRISKVRLLTSVGILALLFLMSLKHPLETLGFLVLVHNFIAFYFWIVRADDKKEKSMALIALTVFSMITAGFLIGVFDSWMQFRTIEILNGWFSDMNVGAQIFPNGDMTLWSRAVSAYAFGQGIHYFVWLKAVPEQELNFQHNTSFKASYELLKGDVGTKIVYLSGFVALAIIAYGIFTNFIEARVIYLSLAALHGYFEIVALAFTKAKSS